MKTKTSFRSGPDHPKWKGGIWKDKDGYLRYSAGPHRRKMVHRVKVDLQLQESHNRHIRADEEVHHQNFIKTCSCDWNLILMDKALHEGHSGWQYHKRRKK